jgi:hypothetical protein
MEFVVQQVTLEQQDQLEYLALMVQADLQASLVHQAR